jgi:hypothetical protein
MISAELQASSVRLLKNLPAAPLCFNIFNIQALDLKCLTMPDSCKLDGECNCKTPCNGMKTWREKERKRKSSRAL